MSSFVTDITSLVTTSAQNISISAFNMLRSMKSIKNMRVENVAKYFVPYDPPIKTITADDAEKSKNNDLISPVELHMLSIHSTNYRSRSGAHLKKIEDVSILNCHDQNNHDSKIQQILRDIYEKHDITVKSLCFSGGGYNCVYHIGVVKFIFEHPEIFKNTKYLGASGGAGIMALTLAYETDNDRFIVLDKLTDFIKNIQNKNLKLHQQVEQYNDLILSYVTEEKFNQNIKNSDRCSISVTNISNIVPKNEMRNMFSSYKSFLDTLSASACVPILLDDKIRKIDDNIFLDGGLSNNLPIHDKSTLKVSCISYPTMSADIYPHEICDIRYCFTPPPSDYVDRMQTQGYHDIYKYLEKNRILLKKQKEEKELNDHINEILS